MKETINQLIKETENKIMDILVRSYYSDRINENGFVKYELKEIKKLLFMRSELDDKLYELLEGCHDEYNDENMEDFN